MAAVNPPGFLQNAGATHTAEITRAAIMGLLSNVVAGSTLPPRGGVHPTMGGVFAITQNGSPNMSVNVASGFAIIPGTEGSKQSGYAVINDAIVNVAIAASNPSLPRIDLIALKVQDSFYSGATDAWSIVAITGTAAGSPVAPALPANAIKIAQIAVGAAVTSIVTGNITDSRPYIAAAGGLISVATQAERDALVAHDGLPTWRRDQETIDVWGGAAWVSFSPTFSTYIGESRNSTTNRVSSGTEIIGNTVTFTSAGTTARYKASWMGTFVGSVTSDTARLRIRHQSGGSLTTGGTQDAIQTANPLVANKGQPFNISATVTGLSPGTWTMGGSVQRASGSGTNSVAANSTDEEYLLIERIS